MKSIGLILILSLTVAGAAQADPGTPDTLRIDSVSVVPRSVASLPVYFYNDEVLSAVELVFKYSTTYLSFDSVSLTGGRLDYIPDGSVYIVEQDSVVDIAIVDNLGWIPRGNGLFGNLFFSVFDSAANQTFVIDSSQRVLGGMVIFRTVFVDSLSMTSFVPQFVAGKIAVGALPPNNDSVWVDSVTAAPGQKVAVNIYGFNQEELVQVRLALVYSSPSLTFDTVIFDNSRGLTASSRVVNSSAQERQILIDLSYTLLVPLPPDSGLLATVLFDVAPTAPDELVIIDSVSYLGLQGLEFVPSSGAPFGPYFHRGYVEIKASTDIKTEEQRILPQDFALRQNAPNPFNPSTTIKFELPKATEVRLDVYNILGQKIRTLVDRHMPAGIYRVTFDGRGDDDQPLASGIYLYRLKAGEFADSRVMVMVK